MNNKKHGCAYCRRKKRQRYIAFNYRPFLRLIREYRAKQIDRETFCVRYGEEQVLAGIKGTGDD
jgi:ribosomal protein L19E